MTSKTVRLGIVGCGMWGTMHARAYTQAPAAELIAVCDIDQERAERTAQEFGVSEVFTSLDEMLELGLDGISVTTPDTAHKETAVKAAAKGINLLVEKPLASTVEECTQIIDAAHKAGVLLMVDWHNRWNPPFYKAYKSIRKGELGDIVYIYERLSDTIFVPTKMLPWAGNSSVLWFLGSHAIDTICWLIGKKPVNVLCIQKEGILKGKGICTPDMFLTIIDFEGGAKALIENSWIIPNSSPALIDHRCDITGTEGVISMDLSHNRTYTKYTAETKEGIPEAEFPDVFVVPNIQGRQAGFAMESIYHFVECVRTGTRPAATGEDGLLNTRIIDAALRSIEHKGPVAL